MMFAKRLTTLLHARPKNRRIKKTASAKKHRQINDGGGAAGFFPNRFAARRKKARARGAAE
jgi:hypothetical protein